MKRRDFLALGAAGVTSIAAAQSTGSIALVQLINFQCTRSRAVDGQLEKIERAAAQAGQLFRCAPVAWQGQSLWPDRFYYAIRALYPATEYLIRERIFDGIQRDGLKFEDLPQVIAYMERRRVFEAISSKIPDFRLDAVAERAGSDEPLLSEYKATLLLDKAAPIGVPVFLWLKGGNVFRMVSPADAAEPVPLVNLAMNTIESLAYKRD